MTHKWLNQGEIIHNSWAANKLFCHHKNNCLLTQGQVVHCSPAAKQSKIITNRNGIRNNCLKQQRPLFSSQCQHQLKPKKPTRSITIMKLSVRLTHLYAVRHLKKQKLWSQIRSSEIIWSARKQAFKELAHTMHSLWVPQIQCLYCKAWMALAKKMKKKWRTHQW